MFRFQLALTPRQKFSILLLDALALLSSLTLIFFLRMGEDLHLLFTSTAFWAIPMVILTFLYIFGAYDLDGKIKIRESWLRSLVAIGIAWMLIIAVNYILGKERMGLFGRGVLIPATLFFFLMSCIYRWILWKWIHRRQGLGRWLFLATPEALEQLRLEATRQEWRGNYSLLLPSSNDSNDQPVKTSTLKETSLNLQMEHRGEWEQLEEFLDSSWDGVVIAAPWGQLPRNLMQKLMQARLTGQSVIEISEFFERSFRKIPVDFLGPEWFVFEKGFEWLHNPLGLRIKRLMDLALATVLILITWPLMLISALLVRGSSPGEILYRQRRTGQQGREFTIYKFRSMRSDAEKSGPQWAQANDLRVTSVGRFLRKTRLDELPQLWNVIRGEMSFIGPRPERPEFNRSLEVEIPFFQFRHLVRPGLTGWAQIRYPYGASVEDAKQKLQYDLYYIKNHSLLLDVQILLKTIQVVLLGQGR